MKHNRKALNKSTRNGSVAEPSRVRRRRSRADRHFAQHLLSVLRTGGDARAVIIEHVRHSLQSRTYENDLKVSVAIDRMAGDIRE